MRQKVRVLRAGVESLELGRLLVEGEIVELEVSAIAPSLFEKGFLELVPSKKKPQATEEVADGTND